MLRRCLFWCHLSCGVSVGLVVLMMSVTGVILTYERQLLARADQAYFYYPDPGSQRLAIAALIEQAEKIPNFTPDSITLFANAAAPVELRAGRRDSRYLNPYTGEPYPQRSTALDGFFNQVTQWHRWFALSGEQRQWGRMLTGIANLGFLFLVISGLYLWLPRAWQWAVLKKRLWFTRNPNAAARDFNWHHVLGLWAAVPLIVIVSTATVFHYTWANNLVYTLAGEEPPQRGGRNSQLDRPAPNPRQNLNNKNYETYIATVRQTKPDWQAITFSLNDTDQISIAIDSGNGGQPQKRDSLIVDAATGKVIQHLPFSSQSAGRQARSWVRFLHTGEALGVGGQTIAGLASLAAVIMVWTGLALAWRRLQRHLRKRRQIKPAEKSLGSMPSHSSLESN